MTAHAGHQEERLREAFQALEVPAGVNERTLAHIEALRASAAQAQPEALVRVSPRQRIGRLVAALAACLCLVVAGVGGYAYATPTAYVQLDGAGQVSLGVNRFNCVVEAQGLDAQGEALVRGCHLTGCDYAEAARRLEEAGLAASSDGDVTVDIACDDTGQARRLRQQSQECLGRGSVTGSGHDTTEAEGSGHGGDHAAALGSGNSGGNGAANGAGQSAGPGSRDGGGNGAANGAGQSAGSGNAQGSGNGNGQAAGARAGSGAGNGNGSHNG